jgi:hypothetical protein
MIRWRSSKHFDHLGFERRPARKVNVPIVNSPRAARYRMIAYAL